jgi:hypothetical protein
MVRDFTGNDARPRWNVVQLCDDECTGSRIRIGPLLDVIGRCLQKRL